MMDDTPDLPMTGAPTIGERPAGDSPILVLVDDRGERFVIDLVGPEADGRAEAAFLADQYHLAATA